MRQTGPVSPRLVGAACSSQWAGRTANVISPWPPRGAPQRTVRHGDDWDAVPVWVKSDQALSLSPLPCRQYYLGFQLIAPYSSGFGSAAQWCTRPGLFIQCQWDAAWIAFLTSGISVVDTRFTETERFGGEWIESVFVLLIASVFCYSFLHFLQLWNFDSKFYAMELTPLRCLTYIVCVNKKNKRIIWSEKTIHITSHLVSARKCQQTDFSFLHPPTSLCAFTRSGDTFPPPTPRV